LLTALNHLGKNNKK